MEKLDTLKPSDEVNVIIRGPEDNILYQSTSSGYHSIESAIENALGNANLSINPEDCVFEISNQHTGVSHRYRINAHGNLKLIV